MKRLMALFFLAQLMYANGQENSANPLDVSFEFRPRFEFRDGYRTLPTDSSKAAAFISSRSRISFDFVKKKFAFHTSLQGVRIWGKTGLNTGNGTFGVFETYADLYLKGDWSLRLGRQAVEFDNGRLFSKANWSQSSRAHDGINLIYTSDSLKSDLLFCYNQTAAANFGATWNPNNYTYLLVHYLDWKLSAAWEFSILNSFDGYHHSLNTNLVYVRGTSGGRATFKRNKFSFTAAAYYQFGKSNSGQNINAYYLQPELEYQTKFFTTKLGAEVLSGDPTGIASTTSSNSFSTLYGVAFKFMGHLNYFTTFPGDVNNSGLVNPYLFLNFDINKKIKLKVESHVFLTPQSINTNEGPSYLGFEEDLKLKYVIQPSIVLDAGFSMMIADPNMEILKSGNSSKIPIFSFLMLTVKPKSNFSKKNKSNE